MKTWEVAPLLVLALAWVWSVFAPETQWVSRVEGTVWWALLPWFLLVALVWYYGRRRMNATRTNAND